MQKFTVNQGTKGVFPWLSLFSLLFLVNPGSDSIISAKEPNLPSNLSKEEYKPSAQTVRRYGKGYRYHQEGWIYLHLEGKPYERGFQHGKLLAEEINEFVYACASEVSKKDPEVAWRSTRVLVNALFLRKFDPEYLEEMKGIADGANAAGGSFDERPLDVIDIAAVNLWPEIFTLGSALNATPTGLEGKKFEKNSPRKMPGRQLEHCSAFAATGPATADGKIVFGHITMFGLYGGRFSNVWIDIKPEKGYHLAMQSFPGGIQSGMDYYINETGLMVCETTIRQTKFNEKGQTLASRIRKVLQYADSIDKAVEILKTENNGLYSNEWLLGDAKTDEIALFELGTSQHKLMRSSKEEWFGNTKGFYWGCNNTKDLQVRLETIPSTQEKPHNMVWSPSERDKTWLKFYQKNQGKISLENTKQIFMTAPITAYPSLDAKITTSAMAKELKTWALL